MPELMTRYSARDLVERLGATDADRQALSAFILAHKQEQELPLYLRALVGVGVFIASLCVLGIMEESKLLKGIDDPLGIAFGAVFAAFAVVLLYLSRNQTLIKNSFFVQTSFTFMAAGKSLFVVALGNQFESSWGVTLALFLVTLVTYPVYRLSIDRFLSSFGVLFSVLYNTLAPAGNVSAAYIPELDTLLADGALITGLQVNGLFLGLLLGSGFLITWGRLKPAFIPLAYAFISALCVYVLFLASGGQQLIVFANVRYAHPVFVNGILVLALVVLIAWAAGSREKLKATPLLLACAGVLGLGFVSAPGILLVAGLMVLGYARHDGLLITGGGLLMPVFIMLYYYNLDVSLMEKSAILVGSGLVLLAGCLYLHVRGLAGVRAS